MFQNSKKVLKILVIHLEGLILAVFMVCKARMVFNQCSKDLFIQKAILLSLQVFRRQVAKFLHNISPNCSYSKSKSMVKILWTQNNCSILITVQQVLTVNCTMIKLLHHIQANLIANNQMLVTTAVQLEATT